MRYQLQKTKNKTYTSYYVFRTFILLTKCDLKKTLIKNVIKKPFKPIIVLMLSLFSSLTEKREISTVHTQNKHEIFVVKSKKKISNWCKGSEALSMISNRGLLFVKFK